MRQRVEPSISSFEVEVDPAALEDAKAAARAHARWRSLWTLCLNVVLFAAVLSTGAALAIRSGVLPPLDEWDFATLPGRFLLLGGFALLWSCQALASLRIFRRNAARGLLTLVIPGYLFVALSREGLSSWFLLLWFSSIAAIGVGTYMLVAIGA